MMPAPLLELQGLTVGYGRETVFRDLDLVLVPRQFAALVGPTGGGKTTLLKAALGILPSSSGSIRLATRVRVGYVPQRETIDWNFPVTVEQVVRMGRYASSGVWPWASKADRLHTRVLLERLGLAAYAKRHIGELSGGQQQRVFLARALVGHPQLLLLDEPTAGVDMRTQHEMLHLLRELNAGGMTILLTTHDLNTVASHLPWVICFNRGLIAQGTPAKVLNPAILRQTYDADMTVVRQDNMTFIANRSLVHRHSPQPGATYGRRMVDGTAG